MGKTVLKSRVEFPLVGPGESVTQPHGLLELGVPVLPDWIALSPAGQCEATADTVNVTVTNPGTVDRSISVYCEHFYTEFRCCKGASPFVAN